MKLQQLVEEKVGFLIVFTVLVISVGLLVQAVPLFFTKEVITPTQGVKPYNALQVAVIQMNGIAFTCSILVKLFLNLICPHSLGWLATKWTQ